MTVPTKTQMYDPSRYLRCAGLDVVSWKAGLTDSAIIDRRNVSLHSEKPDETPRISTVVPDGYAVSIVFASAKDMRQCKTCRRYITECLKMPKFWWTDYWAEYNDDYQLLAENGYFGCEDVVEEDGSLTGHVSWMRALVKHITHCGEKVDYGWYKLNVFAHWSRSTRQAVLLVFDADDEVFERIPDTFLKDLHIQELRDPFWIYPRLLELVIRFQNQTVWDIRGSVRMIEKERPRLRDQPRPEYELLHEIGRHAIHVSETLDVALKTAAAISAQHTEFIKDENQTDLIAKRASKRIKDRLLYFEHVLFSLQARSSSNKDRLHNEISLAFNSVAQYDSRVSVAIGAAAQSDSNAMKTISFLTLAFLPATFISAVFSTSFFNFSPDGEGWTMSNKFWIYLAISIPLTAFTALVWYIWPLPDSAESINRAKAFRDKVADA